MLPTYRKLRLRPLICERLPLGIGWQLGQKWDERLAKAMRWITFPQRLQASPSWPYTAKDLS